MFTEKDNALLVFFRPERNRGVNKETYDNGMLYGDDVRVAGSRTHSRGAGSRTPCMCETETVVHWFRIIKKLA